jgi:cytochrome c-type biogenesis protein CcmF
MDYIGENLFPGQLGHFLVVLSLVASLVATFAYFKSTRSGDLPDGNYWKKLARYAFVTEAISVFTIIGLLYYINSNHLFEYKYAWQHSSRSLEPKYLLASMWEGQEGSFLLWSVWHCVLGLVLIRTGKQWEAPVMTVVSFAQFCLATMVVGLYFFGQKLGSNPFILLRDSGVLDNAPALHLNMDITQPLRPDYMSVIRDGNDLNPLLQNYWMVIHPPMLFLGFASTLIPFAFIIAGMWTGRTGDALKPALPWSLFSLAALGVGIMMGAAWAYESLTFGGYWAWDPVENASLVPWLIMVAAIHTLLIYKHSGHSLRSTYLFLFLQYIFILYSTFLTRSGILGEASVHAFTDLGMNGQLYLFLFVFIWLPAVFVAKTTQQKIITSVAASALLLVSYFIDVPALAFISILIGLGFFIYQLQRQIPGVAKEESTSSREFWMFIGSLVFFLSAIVIISKTSLPVINKIFNLHAAAPEDEEMKYNEIQIFVAIIIGLLSAVTQYLKYRQTDRKYFWKKILIPTIISVVLAGLILAFGNINYEKHGPGYLGAIWIAVAASVYAIVANLAYIWLGLNGKLRISGGSISHFGFGLVLLGILISSSKKEILSHNTSGIAIDFGEESKEKTGENLTLIKGVPMKMGKYDVQYTGDSAHPKKQQWYFNIHFKSRTDNEEFILQPNAFVNYKGNEGLMANPASRHYWDHDVFTYVSALPNPEKNKDTASFRSNPVSIGDSIFYSKGFVVLEKITSKDNMPFEGFQPGDKAAVATLKVHSFNKTSYTSEPLLITKKGNSFAVLDTVTAESLVLRINSIREDGNGADIGLKESNAILQYVTLKAYKFPFIRLLWGGIIITAIGILMSMVQRIRSNKLKAVR